MATAHVSPAANLLRKSRLFALPKGVSFQGSLTTGNNRSDTATLPHPTRAAIVTPGSSLAKGDWGLKRALPAKSTTNKSKRPVVRINALDTFEHVTDFDSAADHAVTLEKFQDLHLPVSLPPHRPEYGQGITPRHLSPFEENVDNTEKSKVANEAEAQRFRLTGPWLAGMTEDEFSAYLKKVQQDRPELLRRLREDLIAKRTFEQKKLAQDNGKDLENLPPVTVTEKEFQSYIKSLRGDPYSMGPVIYELLSIPSPSRVPNDRVGQSNYFPSPVNNLSSVEYSHTGPPKTHPSAGLSYVRTHTSIYNHPLFGPQTHQRPVEARVLRAKRGRTRGRTARAIVGISGIAVDETQAGAFASELAPPGLYQFASAIPGGAKYYVSPLRAFIAADGRIKLTHQRATASIKSAHGIADYSVPGTENQRPLPGALRSNRVPRLDKDRTTLQTHPSGRSTEAVAKNLMARLSTN
ncbi:mitochondrial ribosomal protein MRP51 [Aspergillus crustosus]